MMLDGRMFYFTRADSIRQLLYVLLKESKRRKGIYEQKNRVGDDDNYDTKEIILY